MCRAAKLLFATAVTLVFTPALASGDTRYVLKSGSDWGTVCTVADPCQTLTRAVSVATPGDTIHVGYGAFSELNGVTIDKNLIIEGSSSAFGSIIQTKTAGRPVFEILDGAVVSLTKLMLLGANGVIAGGIANQGSLTLTDVRIFKNSASAGGGAGGIVNGSNASLLLTRVGIQHNYGASALVNFGSAIIVQSWITNNYGNELSDAVANAGLLVVSGSLIASNQGTGLITWNTSGSAAPDGPATLLTNVTISGNTGGGVAARAGTLFLTHVTIANNGVADNSYGGLDVSGGLVSLKNSIVANNTAPQCGIAMGGWVNASHSLLAESSCISPAWPNPSLLFGVDAKLGGLSGRTFGRTHALLNGSPAIDAAGSADCPATDQRGSVRPIDGNGDGTKACDIGAYERGAPKRYVGPIR